MSLNCLCKKYVSLKLAHSFNSVLGLFFFPLWSHLFFQKLCNTSILQNLKKETPLSIDKGLSQHIPLYLHKVHPLKSSAMLTTTSDAILLPHQPNVYPVLYPVLPKHHCLCTSTRARVEQFHQSSGSVLKAYMFT